MDKDVFGAMIGGLCFISVTTVLPLCIMYLRRGEKVKKNQAELPVADIVARLERMEQGMDTMLAEVERIGEGQRFTTKLLNEREPRLLDSVNAGPRRD
jgi:hypothetical protein